MVKRKRFAEWRFPANLCCRFNRSMQHLISKHREEDVENEVSDEDLLHRIRQINDVGSLAKR